VAGTLTISGNGGDIMSYARVRRSGSEDGVIVKRAAILALVCCSLALAACINVNVAGQGDGTRIGGPLDVGGPLRVHGDLHVAGPATIHGPVQARALTVAGPVKTTFPSGEPPGPAGQAFATSLAVGGPLTVRGPLIVEGALIVAGPLTSEPGQESSGVVPQQSQVFAPRGDLPVQKPRPQTEWTE
jgi:hypothetical protein